MLTSWLVWFIGKLTDYIRSVEMLFTKIKKKIKKNRVKKDNNR